MKRLSPSMFAACFASLAALTLPSAAGEADDEVLLQAMRAELERTMEELVMEDLDRPYFVAYTVHDVELSGGAGVFGALLPSPQSRTRRLTVDLRVGDAAYDNTNFPFSPAPPSEATLPLENDVGEIRRRIWLATDHAYKHALEGLANKRAAFQNQTRSQALGDLGPAEPFTFAEDPGPPLPPVEQIESLALDLSRLFTAMPEIMNSRVGIALRRQRTYFVNSEGSSFVRDDPAAVVLAFAETRAADGTVLHDFVLEGGTTWEEIADRESLTRRINAMGKRLAARRVATDAERYIGPVLFEGQAAAELFAQVMVPRLLGTRRPEYPASYANNTRNLGNPFLDKIGARVMARTLNLRDDPTLRGNGFAGGFPVDDEGVPTRVTTLVENGILKTLLTTRNPIEGVDGSTGSYRGFGPVPSNLILTSRNGMSREEMLAEMMLLVEERDGEYGIVVRRLGKPGIQPSSTRASVGYRGGSGQINLQGPALAFKVYPDGREELLRGAEFAAVTDTIFKEIVAASAASTVYSTYDRYRATRSLMRRGFSGGPAATMHLFSVSVPDLLVEELTIREPSGNLPHPPIAAHPFFENPQ
ncbi:MAG: hypothetical protein F4X98_12800 [Gammaproteobacteria bacterium]|nr:hypothetical protein [Gammaproteobacteria bacterium]